MALVDEVRGHIEQQQHTPNGFSVGFNAGAAALPTTQNFMDSRTENEYDHVDIVVSFLKMSGLHLIDGALQDAPDRHAQVRIVTTDYLNLTDLAALARLHN